MDITTLTFSDILKCRQNGSIEELVGKQVRVTGGCLCGLSPVPVIKQLDADTNYYRQDVVVCLHFDSKINNQFANVAVNSEITIIGILDTLEKSLWSDDHMFIRLIDCYLES